MTVNVCYNAALGSSRSEFCINGVWHADFGIADIVERVQDLNDDPYHALHCLGIEAGDAFRLHQILDCLLMQPTELKMVNPEGLEFTTFKAMTTEFHLYII
jgi:hypothetical protein